MMDQNTAKRLLAEGAFFIFLGVPEGTEFGIDMKTWNTGEKFRGVKMIPPGLHFIFFSSKSEILVKKWDKKAESISAEPVTEAEIVNFKENILSLDNFLGPYPYDILEKWKSLSSNISEHILCNLTPKSGLIKSALELQSCSDADRPRGVKKSNEQSSSTSSPSCSTSKKVRTSDFTENKLLPDLQPVKGTEIRLTPFPNKNYPEGSSPSEITQHSLDLTYVFETVLSHYSEPTEIIGEMEFCFICFLVGHSLEAFDQWKKIVTLFCSCEVAIKKYRKIYDMFITILEIHVKEIPEEFLADIVANNNFVYINLKNLFRTIQTSNVDGQLKTKVDRFKNTLTATYLWDFEHLHSEEEDEAPVIVKL